MRTLLICHEDDRLDRVGLARWLASFSELTGLVVLREDRRYRWRRLRREARRSGSLRLLDVLAFRLYYGLRLAARDRRWEAERLERLCARYPDLPAATPILVTASPNTAETAAFVRAAAPDLMIARCKQLLDERVFSLPPRGTFVMHPGICPEYRNAHGCFWALAEDDLARVGMTLLRIDRGVDTGPVYGYYGCDFDELRESHIVIQHRVVLDNLDEIRRTLERIGAGDARPLDTSGRGSAAWGQPWLTRHLRWKARARARRRADAGDRAPLPRRHPRA